MRVSLSCAQDPNTSILQSIWFAFGWHYWRGPAEAQAQVKQRTLPWKHLNGFFFAFIGKTGVFLCFQQLPSVLHGVWDKRSFHQAGSVTGTDVGAHYPQPVWIRTAKGCKPACRSKVSFVLRFGHLISNGTNSEWIWNIPITENEIICFSRMNYEWCWKIIVLFNYLIVLQFAS